MNTHQRNDQLDKIANFLLTHLAATVGTAGPITPGMSHSPVNVNPQWTLEHGRLALQRAIDNEWIEPIPGSNTYKISPAWLKYLEL
ncbi:hypothetical protein LGN20_07330 [Burkholderia cepacia]|uniref:hypothetical protein n=1 Tax=Burkholderia cepacia TaxID=292 RepID=UPI001CF299E3|nr:hypothetical protein [Burkholderia cepacia]MCA8213714.1 hypothetical protein [Burkholderia cepacia]